MININIYHREIVIPSSLIPLGLSERTKLNEDFIQAINSKIERYKQIPSLHINEVTLQRMIEKYSEQAVYRPIDDMRYYFCYAKRTLIEPGYHPLFYPAVVERKFSPNISAVSAIGEGVAGLILQQNYGCRKLVRPYRDGVDIIMTDEQMTYIVEAKGSASGEEKILVNKLDNEYLIKIVTETLSSHAIDIREVKGFLIGVYLEDELNYNCYITKINIDSYSPSKFTNIKKTDENEKKFTVFKQTKTLINQICNTDYLHKLSKEKIYSELEIQLTELVILYVRDFLRNNQENSSTYQIINTAINMVKNILIAKLREIKNEDKISIFDVYFKKINKSFTTKYKQNNYTFIKGLEGFINIQSKENLEDTHKKICIYKLQAKLNDFYMDNQAFVADYEEAEEPLKIITIGFNSSIEGLLIYPHYSNDLQDHIIALNKLPNNFYTTETKYFPIEVYHGDYKDYIFIIDDDGSIYVNTQNLTTDNFYKVGELLIQLAMALYNYPKN
jgi:hypothetical protein